MISERAPKVLTAKLSSKRVPRPLAALARTIVDGLLGFEQFNAVYRRLPPGDAAAFADLFLDALGVRTEFDGEPVESVPAEGPLLVVANHPLGLLDGLLLERLLLPRRPDLAILAAHVFSAIPDVRARHIFVTPRIARRRRNRSVKGWLECLKWLQAGRVLVVYPAGLVSSFRWDRLRVADGEWSPHVAAVARRSRAPVLPVYIQARSSRSLQLLGLVSPLLQNLRAVGAVSAYRGRTLRVTTGRLIGSEELAAFATDKLAIAFLRQRTDALELPRGTH